MSESSTTKVDLKIADLEKRVAELEARLKRAPGESCPSCGALEYRVVKAEPMPGDFGRLGVRQHSLRCKECGFEDVRTVK